MLLNFNKWKRGGNGGYRSGHQSSTSSDSKHDADGNKWGHGGSWGGKPVTSGVVASKSQRTLGLDAAMGFTFPLKGGAEVFGTATLWWTSPSERSSHSRLLWLFFPSGMVFTAMCFHSFKDGACCGIRSKIHHQFKGKLIYLKQWLVSIDPTCTLCHCRHVVYLNIPTIQPLNKTFVLKSQFSLTGVVYMLPSVLQPEDWTIKLDLAHGNEVF